MMRVKSAVALCLAALLALSAAAEVPPSSDSDIYVSRRPVWLPESTEILLAVLADTTAGAASLIAAAQALGVAAETAASPLLVRLVAHEDPQVRKVAAWAMSATGDTSAVRILRRIARRDPDPAVRAQAVWLLRLYPSRRTVVFLGRVATDTAEMVAVRQQAATALGEVGDEAGLPFLDAVLADTSAQLRAATATALSYFWSAGASDLLLDLLGDEAENVRVAAAEALAAMGEPRATGPLAALLRNTARRLPGRLRQAAAAAAVRARPWPDSLEVRRLCAPLARVTVALATLNMTLALDALDGNVRWLSAETKAALVKQVAAIESPATRHFTRRLAQAAQDDDLRRAAAEVLRGN
jgi:HEAT repeat protein